MFSITNPSVQTPTTIKINGIFVGYERNMMSVSVSILDAAGAIITAGGEVVLEGDAFLNFYNTWTTEAELYEMVAKEMNMVGSYVEEGPIK